MRVKIVWKACGDGRWRKGEDITELDKFMNADEIEDILSGSLEKSSEFEMKHMPNFMNGYSLNVNPVNFKILSVKRLKGEAQNHT